MGARAAEIIERGPHHRVWQRDNFIQTLEGEINRPIQYTELAGNLHFWRDEQWNESRAEIQIVPDGAEAAEGAYQVHFAANLNSFGAVTITLPDGQFIRTHLVALAFTDAATGESALLASVQDSDGWLFPPNQVLYPAAFGTLADVRMIYRRSRFESDVIFRENPGWPGNWNLNPGTAMLEVWHELIEFPEPQITEHFINENLADHTLDFGSARMGPGIAFTLGAPLNRASSANVAKTIVHEDGRVFLVEAVPYLAIKDELDALPPMQAAVRGEKNARVALMKAARKPAESKEAFPFKLASPRDLLALNASKGLVLDYSLLTGWYGSYTFQADRTYLISDAVTVDEATFEPAVIKYATTNEDVSLGISGWADFQTATYRPVVFTSQNDRSIGEDLYASGTATNYYVALMSTGNGVFLNVKHARIAYADTAILTTEVINSRINVSHAQIVRCGVAFNLWGANEFNNVLLYDVNYAFSGNSITNTVRHATVHDCGALAQSWSGSSSISFLNSVLVRATNGNLTPAFSFTTESTSSSFFDTAGAGAHYLPSGSAARGAASSAIPEWLLDDLRERTTGKPEIHGNALINTNWTLRQIAPRLTIPHARGFHYPALDYAFGSNILTNATLTIPHGVAVAMFTPGTSTHGLLLERGANIVAEGQPLDPARIVRYNSVQEQANTNWSSIDPGANIKTIGGSVSPQPKGTCSFTEWSVPAGVLHFHGQSGSTERFSFNHCLFNSGRIESYMPAVSFTNCLLERVTGYFEEWPGSVLNHWRNCTFIRGTWTFFNNAPSLWTFYDNLFYETADLGSDGTVSAGYNAYLPGQPKVGSAPGTGDVVTNITFQSGFLGHYYLPATSPLVNAGSRTASSATLYHFTTTTNQSKELNSTVDIGWHSVVMASAARYIDTDDDGLPDYYEDKDSDGVADAGETDWQDNDSDNDGIDDNHFTLYFEMDHPSKPPGNLIAGPGFRVYGDINFQPYGAIWIFFQQTYRGMPLNIWTGIGHKEPHESGILYQLPNPTDDSFRKYLVKYDLRNRRWSITNSSGGMVHHELKWRDNMTERLGNYGPGTLWVTNVNWIQNVTYTPPPFARTVPYIWEGVVGNTSQEPAGPSVHGTWWPILKMVSRGTNVFYTGGFNESKYDLQKFHTTNPQFVVTNVSRTGKVLTTQDHVPTDIAFPSGNTVYVKYSDNAVYGFDATTAENLGSGFPFPSQSTPNVPLSGGGAWAIHPDDTDVVAVYYTNTEQVVVYSSADPGPGVTNFVIGVINGYSNGPSILVPTNTTSFRENAKLCSYHFDGATRVYRPVVCFQSDGRLWIGDAATSRMLRFDTSGVCDAWFMNVAHTYVACADPNDPKRVFMGYLEFEVDYAKPIQKGWTLKNYWGRENGSGRPESSRGDATQNGLYSVVTLQYVSGGAGHIRTYALIRDGGFGNRRKLVELTSTGLRTNLINDLSPLLEMERDGSRFSLNVTPNPQNGTAATFYRDYITSWSGNDPNYTQQTMGTVSYTDNVHPIYWNALKTNGTTVYLFFPSKDQLEQAGTQYTGWHLGAASMAIPGSWLWTKSATGSLDGRGNFDPVAEYAGSTHLVIDDSVFFIYRGEKWQDVSGQQANQFFHYKTDGAFVGQFGTPRFVDGTVLNAPGAAGNVWNFSAVKANGIIYLYTSDEWSHGVHRWRISP